MRPWKCRSGLRWIPPGLAALVLGAGTPSQAQQTVPSAGGAAVAAQPPTQQPPAPEAAPPPPAPGPMAPPAPSSREAQLEARVRQLEAIVTRLSNQMNNGGAGSAPAGLLDGDDGDAPASSSSGGMVAEEPGVRAVPGAADVPGMPNVLPSRTGGLGAPGQSFPPNPPPSNRFNSPATLDSRAGKFLFGPGFELRTNDDEYFFQFHNLTQVEYRGYEQRNQNPVHNTFAIPRQWFMFSGRITQPIGYFVSLSNGFDLVTILDVFIDYSIDPRLNLRFGRYKTPFTYEFFAEPIQGLLLPERSLFFNNFGQNRDVGLMGYGRLAEGKLDYAAGIFNANRNGYVANLDDKSLSAYVNSRPFGDAKDSLLENFNIGGSVFAGTMNNPPVPSTMRTLVPTSGNAVAGVPFLGFNSTALQKGPFAFWDLHAAWFYKQLAVIGEWQSGYQDYAHSSTDCTRTRVPVQSWYVEAGYLLTGETRSSVGLVKPLRPFDLRPGHFGLGAWEVTGRYNLLDISPQVFPAGLADPNLWANRVYTTDVGFNWHMTQYLKFYFFWEHEVFSEPVYYAPGKLQSTSDAFLARLQLYF